MRNRCRASALLLSGLVATGCALAQKPSNITDSELAMLPEFCLYTVGFKLVGTPKRKQLHEQLGDSFRSLHHYCWAQINLRRLRFKPSFKHSKAELAVGIIGDLNYVLQHSTPDFVLLPEVYTTLIEAELLRDNPAAAVLHVREALRLKDDYVRPYQVWGEYLVSHGPPAAAREFLKPGLEHNPQDLRLRELYTKAGGDPSTIVPRPRPAPAPASAAAAQAPAASAPASAPPPQEPATPPSDAASVPTTR